MNKKNETGITLVALVVTIIVLLILAGIAINLTVGNNGIFTRAKNSTDKWDRADIIEKAKLDIMDRQAQKAGKFTETDLTEILNKYGNLSSNEEETILDQTLTTNNKKHEIKVSEIWNEPFTDATINIRIDVEALDAIEPSELYKNWGDGNFELPMGISWTEFINSLEPIWSLSNVGFAGRVDNNFVYYLESYSSTAGYIGYPLVDKNGSQIEWSQKIIRWRLSFWRR